MEILIAILWYLQLIFAGNTYTTQEINQMVISNQPVIYDIQSRPEMTNIILNDFNKTQNVKIGKDAIDVWEEDPAEPIPN